ncbi:MAG: dienelactone hydrolase family protein [Thermodesulfobacteriota bacterium]
MSIQIIIAVLLVITTAAGATAADMVTFKGDDQEVVTGRLMKPEGDGPFPAVILLHGVDGMDKHYDAWAERLAHWGYVTLQIDDFGPRGKSSHLSDPPSKRAKDVCSAKSYLAGLAFVDPKRVGAIGWSRRGSSTLAALCARSSSSQKEYPLRAVVAFYPYCFRSLASLEFPLLILIGELDDLSPVATCRERMPQKKTRHEVILKVYSSAYHGFDVEEVKTKYMDHRIEYNQAAAADSIVQVKAFLAKHMK